MSQHLLQKLPMLITVPTSIEANQTSTSLETVSRHLEFIHGVDVLNMALDRRTIWRAGKPEVEVLVSSSLKVECVIARMKVGQLVDQVKGGFRIQLGICFQRYDISAWNVMVIVGRQRLVRPTHPSSDEARASRDQASSVAFFP